MSNPNATVAAKSVIGAPLNEPFSLADVGAQCNLRFPVVAHYAETSTSAANFRPPTPRRRSRSTTSSLPGPLGGRPSACRSAVTDRRPKPRLPLCSDRRLPTAWSAPGVAPRATGSRRCQAAQRLPLGLTGQPILIVGHVVQRPAASCASGPGSSLFAVFFSRLPIASYVLRTAQPWLTVTNGGHAPTTEGCKVKGPAARSPSARGPDRRARAAAG